MKNDVLNTTELMTGKDGKLFVTVRGTQYFLAEINQYSVVMNVTSVDVQPVGSIVVAGVPTGVSFDLTFTEMVVRDDVLMVPLLEGISDGVIPVFDFQGVAIKPDGTEQRFIFNEAYPNGTVGLQSLSPGEVVTREQSYRLNKVPQFVTSLASTYLSQ